MIYTYLPGYKGGTPTWNQYYAENIQKEINDTVAVLRNAGYSDAIIAGILGNVWQESQFNENATNKSNGRRGYFQHLPKDYNWLVKNYGHGLSNQIRYIIDWDRNPKKVGLYTYGYKPKDKWNPNVKTPEMAADTFLNAFERAPGQGVQGRRAAARAYYDWLVKYHPEAVSDTNVSSVIPAEKPAPLVWPTDATTVVKPIDIAPIKPTSYIDPSIQQTLQTVPEIPEEQDNDLAMQIPGLDQYMMQYLAGQVPYAQEEPQFFPGLDLPGAKNGKASGIHIKASHRGRFTRYLKAHPGMTAEKAKHSKSAAVRRMATFALNARKWKH